MSSKSVIHCGTVLFILSFAKNHICNGISAFEQRPPLFVVIKNEIRHRPSGGHIRFPIDHTVTYDELNEQQGIYLSIMKWWSRFPITCQFATSSHCAWSQFSWAPVMRDQCGSHIFLSAAPCINAADTHVNHRTNKNVAVHIEFGWTVFFLFRYEWIQWTIVHGFD